MFCPFYEFTHFDEIDVLQCFYCKALLHYRREYDVCVVVLPSFWCYRFLLCFSFLQFDVGEIHRVVRIINSHSPLSEPEFYFRQASWQFMSGRFTGEERLCYTLVLPSVSCLVGFLVFVFSVVGENTQGSFCNSCNSRSPLYEPETVYFLAPILNP